MQISRGLEKEKERDSGGLCKKLGYFYNVAFNVNFKGN
jgi:hypothetical protein